MLNDWLQALALDKNTGLVYFSEHCTTGYDHAYSEYVGVVYMLGIIN